MDAIFSNLMLGFDVALTSTNIMWVFIGGLLGTVIGMLPGLGPATGVAVLIPITYGMNPTTALITMCAVYYGAMFGGSRASIMINTPGDASAIVACFDGYPMTQQGRGQEALAIAFAASAIGGLFTTMITLGALPYLSKMVYYFGSIENFVIILFGVALIAQITGGSMLKGLIAGMFGLLLGAVGYDHVYSGVFTYLD